METRQRFIDIDTDLNICYLFRELALMGDWRPHFGMAMKKMWYAFVRWSWVSTSGLGWIWRNSHCGVEEGARIFLGRVSLLGIQLASVGNL